MSRFSRWIDPGLLSLAVAAGLAGGLIEGMVHIGLHFLEIDDNSWYPIIWISAVFNGALVGSLGLIFSLLLKLTGRRDRVRQAAVFLLLLAACIPWLALLLKNWMGPVPGALLIIGIVSIYAYLCNREPDITFQFARRMVWPLAGLTLTAFLLIEGGSWIFERARTAMLPVAQDSAPNVLMIVIDTLRADHLSVYGYGRKTSPAIDRLAAGGVQFMSAYSSSSYTLPTHVSMLTGLYPAEHGITWANTHKRIPAETLPEALLEKGYRTGAFSGNTFYFTREHGFGRGFLHFEDFFHSAEDMAWRTAWGGLARRLIRPRLGLVNIPARKRPPDTNRAVLQWTRLDADRPFFVMVNYMDLHDPYMPPQPYRSMFSTQQEPGGLLTSKKYEQPVLSQHQLQGEMDAYDGAIAYVDHHLEQLLAKLRDLRTGRQLLVIVTSDHGEEFGEHGGYLHARHIYREAIHVPLIVWGPGRIPAGATVNQPVSITALPATVMVLLGDQNPRFPGPSLDRLWTADAIPDSWPQPLAELLQREHATPLDPIHHGSMRSLISGSWQYIEQQGLGRELFDMAADPDEHDNLASQPEYQDVLDSFAARLAPRDWQHKP